MPLFYLQLYAVVHNINETFAFYLVSATSCVCMLVFIVLMKSVIQLTILNGASVTGRVAPGFVFKYVGVVNIMIICGACCVVLLFSLLAMKTLAAVTVFAVLFGFVSGACECFAESL